MYVCATEQQKTDGVIIWCVIFLCSLKVSRGCTTELTHQGYQFFSSLFDKYDEVS